MKVIFIYQFKKILFLSKKTNFLSYIILSQNIYIKDKKIKIIKNWFKFQLIKNI